MLLRSPPFKKPSMSTVKCPPNSFGCQSEGCGPSAPQEQPAPSEIGTQPICSGPPVAPPVPSPDDLFAPPPPPPPPAVCPGDALEVLRLFSGLLLDLSPPWQSSLIFDIARLVHYAACVLAALENDRRLDALASELAERSQTFFGGMSKAEVKSALARLRKALPKEAKDWLRAQWACRTSA